MSLLAKVGAFNTTTGSSNVVVSDVGFQPKAILFWWSGRTETTDTQARNSHFAGIGCAVSTTSRWAATSNDIDAAAAQDASSAKTTVGCILSVDAAGAVDGRLDLASIDSGGFTLLVSDAMPRDQRIHYLALGGTDITDVAAGEFQRVTGTPPYTQDITAPGFQPDLILLAGTWEVSTGGAVATAAGGVLSLGAATGPSNEGVIGLASDEASATMDTDGYGFTGESIAKNSQAAGGTISTRAEFSAMLSNGFRVNWLEVSATLAWTFWLALKGGSYHVNNAVTSVTGGATIPVSGFGFAPKGVLVFSACRATSTQDAATAPWHHSIGAGTGPIERGAQGTISRDGVADSVVGTAVEHDEVYVSQTDATPPVIDGLMDINSMDSDGVTFIMDDGDGVARRFFYVGFGDTPVAGPSTYPGWFSSSKGEW